MPLDTHTFKIAQKLNLLQRKRYDLESAVLLTSKLKEFDLNDFKDQLIQMKDI